MTPAEIKKTRLYRTLAPCVRKQDREELARMLEIVDWTHSSGSGLFKWDGLASDCLVRAFWWHTSPQGDGYWRKLSDRLYRAGHECW